MPLILVLIILLLLVGAVDITWVRESGTTEEAVQA
jgi:hypothetical protein